MRAELEALIDELKEMKRDGIEQIYLADDTLQTLAARAKAAGALQGKPAPLPNQARPTEASEVSPPPPPPPAIPKPEEIRAMLGVSDPASDSPAPTTSRVTVKPSSSATVDGIAPIPAPPQFKLPSGSKQKRWDWLKDRVVNCPVCNEHLRHQPPASNVVFGVGSLDADIFFCGEAPGADEDRQGEPFVGKAGQLLTKIIEAMGLSRERVYIGNIMNWRPELPSPTGNRPPTEEEMAFCLPYLRAQIEIVQPKVIVALGMTAVSGLLGPDPKRRMGKIRGTWLEFEGTPLMPTYHPSYLLQYATKESKRKVWEDMLAVMEKVDLPISEKQRGFFA